MSPEVVEPQRKFDNSLKISIIIVSIIMSLLLFESYLSYRKDYENEVRALDSLSSALKTQVETSVENIKIKLDETQLKVQLLGDPDKVDAELLHLLFKQVKVETGAAVVALSDSAGKFYASSDKAKPGINIADRDYFKEMKSSASANYVSSGPVVSKTLGIWVFVYSKAVRDEKTNEFKGTLLFSFPVEKFNSAFEKIAPSDNGSIALLNSKLELIARWPRTEELTGKVVNILSIPKSLDQVHYEYTSPVDNISRIYNHLQPQVLGANWYLIVGRSTSHNLQIWIGKLGGYLVLFLVIVFGIWFSNRRQQITNIKIAEQRLKLLHSAKLSSLGEMAGGVSHEINNPLAIIRANADYINNYLTNNNSEIKLDEVKRRSEKIISASVRIEKIIRSMRKISRDGESDPVEVLSANIVLQNVLELCNARFRNKNIKLEIKVDETLRVRGRDVQIEQVLVNLLNNAHDAVVTLDNPWVSVEIKAEGDMVEFIVANSGPQIAADIQAKIMMPFFTTKAPGMGTGLGLSISQKIAQDHGGSLMLLGNAAHPTFVLSIPRA
jgi:C4-dicarboxylate-specific signal transduction histidine kinase